MPYRQQRRRRRRRPQQITYGQIGSKIYRDVQHLKALINVEFKHKDTAQSAAITTTGSIARISNIGQGDDFEDRQGRSIKVVSLAVNWQAEMSTAATGTLVRFMIVADMSADGVDPTLAEILDTVVVRSHMDLNNSRRFKVLYNKLIALSDNGASNKVFSKFLTLNHHVKYRGTDDTEGSAAEGNMYVLRLSDEATNTPTVGFNLRLRFIDN